MSKNKKRIKVLLGIIGGILLGVLVIQALSEEQSKEITYDELITLVETNEVSKVETKENSARVTVILNDGTERTSMVPSINEFSALVSEKIKEGAEIQWEAEESFSMGGILTIVFVTILLFLPEIIEKRQEKKYKVKSVESRVKFSDVAGIDEEKAQLEEIVQFLKYPEKYTKNGAKIPKGILLHGQPGTGKTLLAKAIAGEADVPFFQTNGSSFEEMFVGVGASRIRELFNKAKKEAPCIIFIDEIDSIARSRYSKHSDNEQTLNQLLAEMDGFDSDDNVIVIAATNHIDVLDAAIIRPGRFDRHVYIPMPDVIAREKILRVHADNKKLEEDVSLKEIARKTVGFSGADLENVLNEAVIYSVNQGNGRITKEAIDESIARTLVGLQKKNAAITESDKELTAVHESGHAIVSAIVRPEVKNFGISIIPRGEAGGYNFFDNVDTTYQRKSDLFKQIQVSYGGRIAEEVVFDDISSGAASDLEMATKTAYRMVMRFAMNEGLVTKISSEEDFNTRLDSVKMEEVEKICKKAYDSAYAIIQQNKTQLLELADLLKEKEYLSQEEVEEFMREAYS